MEPFLIYIRSTYPEIPKLCKELDSAAGCILEGRQINSLTLSLEGCASDIEEFFRSKEGRHMPPHSESGADVQRESPLHLSSSASPLSSNIC